MDDSALRDVYRSGNPYVPSKVEISLAEPGPIHGLDIEVPGSNGIKDSLKYNKANDSWKVVFAGQDVYSPASWDVVKVLTRYFAVICSCENKVASITYRHLNTLFTFGELKSKFNAIELSTTNIERIIDIQLGNQGEWKVTSYTLRRSSPYVKGTQINYSAVCINSSVTEDYVELSEVVEIKEKTNRVGGVTIYTLTDPLNGSKNYVTHLSVICHVIRYLITSNIYEQHDLQNLVKNPLAMNNYYAKELFTGFSSQIYPVGDMEKPKLPIGQQRVTDVIKMINVAKGTLSISGALSADISSAFTENDNVESQMDISSKEQDDFHLEDVIEQFVSFDMKGSHMEQGIGVNLDWPEF